MKAWLQTKGSAYHLRVLVDQREFQKSLGKISADAAQGALGTVCGTIIKVKQGLLDLPYDGSPIPFLLSGGTGHLVSRDLSDRIPVLSATELYLVEEAEEAAGTYVAAQRTEERISKPALDLMPPLHQTDLFFACNWSLRRLVGSCRCPPFSAWRQWKAR